MWNEIMAIFRAYMGSGLIFIWFLISELYLFRKEKRKHIRILFFYVPMIILAIFFCPLFGRLMYRFGDMEGYYRVLWLIPVTVVIAFTVVEIFGRLRGRRKWEFFIAAVAILMASGNYIYGSPLFTKAENGYHVPESVVEICDAIEVEGREVRAVFPAELIQYVRQYSPVICMPYGREILVERWGNQDELYDLMEADEIDAEVLAARARARECHYIILSKEKKQVGSLQDYDYELFGQVQNYNIYKDSTVNLGLQ